MKKKCEHKNVCVVRKELWEYPKGYKEYDVNGFLVDDDITEVICEDCHKNLEET